MNTAVVKLAAAVLAVLAALAPAALANAQAEDSGIIEGQVINGTAAAPAPADIEVIVHVLTNRDKTGEHRIRTDAQGRFRLDSLATGPEMLYFPIVEYQRVAYFPERPVAFQTAEPAQVGIAVYEATPTSDSLTFERLNMLVVNVTPTAMTIMEMGAVVNGSDRTFAANAEATGSARTLRFVLPPGATQIAPQTGLPADSLESIPDGFATTDAVKPGRREIAFSYELPYQSASVDLARSFTLPVGSFSVYLPDEAVQLVGPDLTLNGTPDLGGRQFRQYTVQNVAPGSEVRFRLTGLPAPFFATPRELGLAVTASASVALGAFLFVAVRRRRLAHALSPRVDAQASDPAGDAAAAERQRLVRAVAELDERFAAGALDEAAYQAQREAQKSRLVELTAVAVKV